MARATSSRGIPNVIDRGYCGRAGRDGGAGEDKKETREVHTIITRPFYLQNTNRHLVTRSPQRQLPSVIQYIYIDTQYYNIYVCVYILCMHSVPVYSVYTLYYYTSSLESGNSITLYLPVINVIIIFLSLNKLFTRYDLLYINYMRIQVCMITYI